MKVQHLAPGLWDVAVGPNYEPSSLSLAAAAAGFKRLFPLATGLSSSSSSPDSPASTVSAAFDLKSFIRSESTARKLGSSSPDSSSPDSGVKRDSRPPMETHPGVTRWNPTLEQVGILEALYRTGMRTPSAQQIEQITAQLRKFGKIEGKNVFYWFQNHKARERQKQKRHNLGLGRCPSTPTSPTTVITSMTLSTTASREEVEMIRDEDDSPYKKRCCPSWAFEPLQGDQMEQSCRAHRACGEDRTLELFPLHPEP